MSPNIPMGRRKIATNRPYMEITSPGFGVPGTIAIIAFLIIFLGGALLGTVGSLEIVLFLLGVILLVIEIFLIPGFGVTGISGIVLMIAALVLARQEFVIPRVPWEWTIFLRNLRNVGFGHPLFQPDQFAGRQLVPLSGGQAEPRVSDA